MTNVSRVWPSHCSFFALQSATSLPTHCDRRAFSFALPLPSPQLPPCLQLDNCLVRHQAVLVPSMLPRKRQHPRFPSVHPRVVLVPSMLLHRHQHSCFPPVPFLVLLSPTSQPHPLPLTLPPLPQTLFGRHLFIIRQIFIKKVQACLRAWLLS